MLKTLPGLGFIENLLPQETDFNNWTGAILLCIDSQSDILLFKRSLAVPSHKGQISLPGGGKKRGELPFETALREFEEEWPSTSLAEVKIIGLMPPLPTLRKQNIVPVIARISHQWENRVNIPQEKEWDDAFTVNIKELFREGSWGKADYFSVNSNDPSFFYFRPLDSSIARSLLPSHPSTGLGAKVLWGLTAHIFWNLYHTHLFLDFKAGNS